MWDQIKQVIDTIGGKFVIAEGGKPRYIVLAFDEFKRIISGAKEEDGGVPRSLPVKETGKGPMPTFARETGDDTEDINHQIAALARQEEEANKIKIEELPF